MSRRMLVPLKFLTLSTDPSNGSVGEVYVNTVTKNLRVHNGDIWIDLTPASTDPSPFYMHTHTYDGDVHTIDIENPINFLELNKDANTPEITLPEIIGIIGGDPSSESTAYQQDLDLFDGGAPNSIYYPESGYSGHGGGAVQLEILYDGGDSTN